MTAYYKQRTGENAQKILQRCNDARIRVWRKDCQREVLEEYYNSGEMPDDGCGKNHDSLGLGNRHMRRAHKQLRATQMYDGGPLEIIAHDPDDYEKKICLQDAFEKEANDLFKRYYKNITTQLAGGYVVFGRAIAWRPSKWDIRFRVGRPLVAHDATLDIHDDDFWWWAFPMRLTYRDIDHLIANKRGDDDRGWSVESLESLKEYILTTANDNHHSFSYDDSGYDRDKPFDDPDEILDCYIYFEKAEAKTSLNRKINVRIVSRMTETSSVHESNRGSGMNKVRQRNLSLKSKSIENERILYKEDDAFDSVDECLIIALNDARISTDNHFDDVQGDGDQFLPRYLMMEDMMQSFITGVSFGMQPQFAATRNVDKRVLQRLQEHGLPRWSVAPQGVEMMDKSNVINSSNAGLQGVQTLGLSIDEEASTGQLPSFAGQRPQAEFAAEAQQLVQGTQENQSLMFDFWHEAMDQIATQFGKTISRTEGWSKSDPSYYEVKHFQEKFKEHGLTMADLKNTDWEFMSRRLPGGNDKATALQRFMTVLNRPDAPAFVVEHAWKEVIRLLFGCKVAAQINEPDQEPLDRSQAELARQQATESIVFGVPAAVEKGDDPEVHTQINMQALQAFIAKVAQKGYREASDDVSLQALALHMTGDIENLAGQTQQQVIQAGEQLFQQYGQIPQQKPATDADIKQGELQLKAQAEQRQQTLGSNLMQSRERDANRKDQSMQIDMAARAKQLQQTDEQLQLQKEKIEQDAIKLLQQQNA